MASGCPENDPVCLPTAPPIRYTHANVAGPNRRQRKTREGDLPERRISVRGDRMMVRYLLQTAVCLAAIMLGGAISASAQQSPAQPSPAPSVERSVNNILMQNAEPKPNQNGQVITTPGQTAPGKKESAKSATGVTAIQGERRSVTIGGQGAFEPILNQKIPTVELPDEGELISLNASDAAVSVIEVLDSVATATGWNSCRPVFMPSPTAATHR